jgi:hypothetical protein
MRRQLEIRVSYQPTRRGFAPLQEAYERALPIRRRQVSRMRGGARASTEQHEPKPQATPTKEAS